MVHEELKSPYVRQIFCCDLFLDVQSPLLRADLVEGGCCLYHVRETIALK